MPASLSHGSWAGIVGSSGTCSPSLSPSLLLLLLPLPPPFCVQLPSLVLGMSQPKVFLVSQEGQQFELEHREAVQSVTVRDLLAAVADDDGAVTVPLDNIAAATLDIAVRYMKHLADHPEQTPQAEGRRRDAALSDSDREFTAACSMEELSRLALAANYLDVRALLDLALKSMAHRIHPVAPAEIKTLFGISRDFTPEEYDRTVAENPWLAPPESAK